MLMDGRVVALPEEERALMRAAAAAQRAQAGAALGAPRQRATGEGTPARGRRSSQGSADALLRPPLRRRGVSMAASELAQEATQTSGPTRCGQQNSSAFGRVWCTPARVHAIMSSIVISLTMSAQIMKQSCSATLACCRYRIRACIH